MLHDSGSHSFGASGRLCFMIVVPFSFRCIEKTVLHVSGSLVVLMHREDCASRKWLSSSFGTSGRLRAAIVAPFFLW